MNSDPAGRAPRATARMEVLMKKSPMKRSLAILASAALLTAPLTIPSTALAQGHGGGGHGGGGHHH